MSDNKNVELTENITVITGEKQAAVSEEYLKTAPVKLAVQKGADELYELVYLEINQHFNKNKESLC